MPGMLCAGTGILLTLTIMQLSRDYKQLMPISFIPAMVMAIVIHIRYDKLIDQDFQNYIEIAPAKITNTWTKRPRQIELFISFTTLNGEKQLIQESIRERDSKSVYAGRRFFIAYSSRHPQNYKLLLNQDEVVTYTGKDIPYMTFDQFCSLIDVPDARMLTTLNHNSFGWVPYKDTAKGMYHNEYNNQLLVTKPGTLISYTISNKKAVDKLLSELKSSDFQLDTVNTNKQPKDEIDILGNRTNYLVYQKHNQILAVVLKDELINLSLAHK